MENKMIKCSVCEQEFSLKKNLYAHCRNIHQIELLDKKEHNFRCELCDMKLSKHSLPKHLAKFHNVIPKYRKSRLSCPSDGCEEEFMKNAELREHLTERHGVIIQMEEIQFSSTAEFKNWKICMQKETLSSYVADTSVRTLANGDKRRFFNCHRSFNFCSKAKKIKASRSIKTNKINRACPSRIEMVSTINDEVQIKFWKTHCGHSKELGRKIHIVTSSSGKSRLVCPLDGCEEKFMKNSDLRLHITEKHGVNIQMEEMHFSSMADFENWKICMQRETLSFYVADTSVKTLANGDKSRYLNCHRSLNFCSKAQNMKTSRSMNTNKINRACPSRIEMVSTINNEVKIKFWKTHCGHSVELDRVTLDKLTRAKIAGKLAEGVKFETKKNFMKKNDECNTDAIKRKLDIIVGLSAGVSLNDEDARSVNKKLDDVIQIFNNKTNLEQVKEVNIQKINNQTGSLHDQETFLLIVQ